MTLNAGDVLVKRYRIVRPVGQGGFGAVYRAWDLALKAPVAVKENFDADPLARQRFEGEAILLARLRHENLPRVIDHFVVPDQGQYLVMDFVEGKSLEALLKERGGPLDEAEALPWIAQVCGALAYLHRQSPPVIHRDVKPANIIITADGRAMLVDFGISKLFAADHSTATASRAVTPGYSPPEQYGAGKTDARSDVYALGATLYTLLTGRTPPESVALMADSSTPLPPPRQLNSTIQPLTERAILQAMALSMSQRLQTAEALRTALQTSTQAPLLRGMAAGRVTTAHMTNGAVAPSESAAPRALSWSWPLAALAVLAALALLAWGVWALTRPDEPTVVPTDRPAPTVQPATAAPSPNTRPAATTPATESVATAPPTTGPPTPTPAPVPDAGQTRSLTLPDGTQVEQVYAPAGSFLMGRDDGLEEDERPAHPVTLDGFWIDRTEVTNAQFAAFVDDTGYQTTAERRGGGETQTAGNAWDVVTGANWRQPRGPGSDLDGQELHPVVLVTWEDADAFCRWRSGRLPTEAEWEYAARGPDGRQFPWGDFFETSLLNYCDDNCPTSWSDSRVDDGYAFAAPVGSYPGGASWIGALDLIGNVYEWVNDWFDAGYYARSPAENPTGPADGGQKVQRGGSWRDYDDVTYAAYRFSDPATTADFNTGFRCASSE